MRALDRKRRASSFVHNDSLSFAASTSIGMETLPSARWTYSKGYRCVPNSVATIGTTPNRVRDKIELRDYESDPGVLLPIA